MSVAPSSPHPIRRVDPDDPDAAALMSAYFEELRARLGGFDRPSAEQLRSDAATGVVLVAHDTATAVACGSLRLLDAETAEIKRMFVTQGARGRGHARTMLRALEGEARARGCARIVLDTAAPLAEAASLYLAEGYREVAAYNDNPFAARWFEKRLR
ncbi:MAG: GNAT family N-acetyltransferase [Polyangiaceae bacterium]